jgi:hypothetical protein
MHRSLWHRALTRLGIARHPLSSRKRPRPVRRCPLALEPLEDRLTPSAPGVVSLSGDDYFHVSGDQFKLPDGATDIHGSAFLGGNFNVGSSFGQIVDAGILGQYGAQAAFNLNGHVGLDVGYFANDGTVKASYGSVSLQQNFTDPTQVNQEVNFTPQNTSVSYQDGTFQTVSPNAGVYETPDVNINGSASGAIAFGGVASASTSFSGTLHPDPPLVAFTTHDGLQILGQSLSLQRNGNVFGVAVSGQVGVPQPSVEIPITIAPGVEIKIEVSPNDTDTGLKEEFKMDAGIEGTDAEISLGEAHQGFPSIDLNSTDLQDQGVLTASQSATIADLSLQMGPLAASLLGLPEASALLTSTTINLLDGMATLEFTPVSFQLTPSLDVAQTGTVTPTNQLTYNFSSPVVVTLDGQVQNGGNPESAVTFTPGVDTLGVGFTGSTIAVTPTWTIGENYTNQIELDANLKGTLTVGELSGSLFNVGSFTLGPLYQQDFDLAHAKLATLDDQTFSLGSRTITLPQFTIGNLPPNLQVTTTDDTGGQGSLRYAVNSANQNYAGGNTGTQVISLGPGTYNLTSASGPSLNIASNLLIVGAGAGQTIINAAGLGSQIFVVHGGYNATLEGVTLTGGGPGLGNPNNTFGGGILNQGTLTISDSVVSNNSGTDGGAVYNEGVLTIENSTISDNSAWFGGGIGDGGVQLTIDNSTIAGNSAVYQGGGYSGGGDADTISNSTIAANSAPQGGGIDTEGTLKLLDCTVTGNSASDRGAGVFNFDYLAVINSTIVGNSAGGDGGGLWTNGGMSDVLLYNAIVAGNGSGTGTKDVAGPVQLGAYDLIGDGTGLSGISNGVSGSLVGSSTAPVDPKLAPLGFYGGPTGTMIPLLGSPVLAAGSSALAQQWGLSTDQRGLARSVRGTVDLGAVEPQYDLSLTGSVAVIASRPAEGVGGSGQGDIQYLYEFSYTETNNGPDPTVGATLTVPLPPGVAFWSLSLPDGWTESGPDGVNNGTITFTDSAGLNPGQSADFTVTVELQNSAVGAVFSIPATVGPTASDTNPQNDAVTLGLGNAQEGQPIDNVLLFRFVDANANETANDFTASVDWGDNSSNVSTDGSGTVAVVADPGGGFDVLGSHNYGEEGRYGASVSVSGLDSTAYHGSSQDIFVVADAPLTAGALTPPPQAVVNQPLSNMLLFHFTDADRLASASDYTVTVAWGDNTSDSSGDGSGNVTVVANTSGGFDVYGSHTYSQAVNPGTFSVQVSDAGGASISASNPAFQVLGADLPLTAGALTVPSVTGAGQAISNQVLFHFSDADPSALASDYVGAVSWGDGRFNRSDDSSGSVLVVANPGGGFDVVGSHVYEAGSFYFAVKVTDLGDLRSAQPDLGGSTTGASSAARLVISTPSVGNVASTTANGTYTLGAVVNITVAFGANVLVHGTPQLALNSGGVATYTGGSGTNTLTFTYTVGLGQSSSLLDYTSASAVTLNGGAITDFNGRVAANLTLAAPGSAGSLGANSDIVIVKPTPTVSVADAGGTFNGQPYPAAATVAGVITGVDNTPAAGLEGVSPALTYYAGNSAAGTPLAGAPTQAGAYTVVTSFAGSADYAAASASAMFSIAQATPTISVSDAGGTYTGQPFPATAAVAGVVPGVDSALAASLEGVIPTLAYYAGNSAAGTPLAGAPTQAGTYTVVASYAGSTDYTAASAGTTFTIQPGSTISGITTQDLTGNGFSADDTALGGVTIALYKDTLGTGVLNTSADTLAATTVTAGDGSYSFLVAPGVYFVQEVVPAGDVQTGGGPNGSAGATDYILTGTSGSSSTGNNFDNFIESTCPATNISFAVTSGHNAPTTVSDLRGNTHQGDLVTATFTIPAGTSGMLTLVSYIAPGPSFNAATAYQDQIYDDITATFGPGTHTLSVYIPSSYYEIDFVNGPAIDEQGNPNAGPDRSNIFYTPQGRLLSADNGGTQAAAVSAVARGDFASIGFWRNRNGQAVINSFNGSSTSTSLGNWLAANFPHLFGSANYYIGSSLAEMTNAQIATVYQGLWTPNGVNKNTFIQAFAVALGLYADNASLSGVSLAAQYGFNVTNAGPLSYNVGSNGAAFGVANNTSVQVLTILQDVDASFDGALGTFFDGNANQQTLTTELNTVLSGINETGGI